MEAEIGVLQLQARARLWLSEAGSGKKDRPLGLLEGACPADNLISVFQPPELQENTFLFC